MIIDWLANSAESVPRKKNSTKPVTYKGKQWVRQAICGAVDGQLPPQSDLYPENMIGLIAVNADQPEKGAYFARIKKVSSGAWECVLVIA